MVLSTDKDRIKKLLTDTITLLCKNGISFNLEFNVEALIGITVDKDDVFLVSINQTIKSQSSLAKESSDKQQVPESTQQEPIEDCSIISHDQGKVSKAAHRKSGNFSRKRQLSDIASVKKERDFGSEACDTQSLLYQYQQNNDSPVFSINKRFHSLENNEGETPIKKEADHGRWDSHLGQLLPGTSMEEEMQLPVGIPDRLWDSQEMVPSGALEEFEPTDQQVKYKTKY